MTTEILTDFDLHLIGQGSHYQMHEKLGAHPFTLAGAEGISFCLWAPNAKQISVVGDFNSWDREANPLAPRANSGLWEGFVPGLRQGALYKYFIRSQHNDYEVDKADPYAYASEIRPQTASKVWDISNYEWNDHDWMDRRASTTLHKSPMSIYEVHLGSWMRNPDEGNRWLTYRELAPKLAEYINEMGFTHVELLPVAEHPFDGSWGYQPVGFYSPTSRFGTPDDFMHLVDTLHQHGIGVILDWVPAHFPSDEHGLGYFDGTHLYEHADPRQGHHPDWNTLVFNYGRAEVQSFLIGNALFWFDKYHVDALRVDAVASMLYLNYSRKDNEWIPNREGGNENLEAIAFLRTLNEQVHAAYPGATVIAEESTAWPGVSRPTSLGGLGFGFKWNMGWMHDMLSYMAEDPVHRSFHQSRITFGMLYAFSENFILPFSHDEVVHGKGSMLRKMPGDDWQKFANLRLLYGFMFTHPGKKLLFMGCEFGQWNEWNHDSSLDWHLLGETPHAGLKRWVRDLNTFYRGEPALYESDFDPSGFEWIDCSDSSKSVVSFLRLSSPAHLSSPARPSFAVVCNFTPVPRHNYRIGVPSGGYWHEVLNSDAPLYYGSGQGNQGGVESTPLPMHGRPFSLNLTLPPLAIVVFRHQPEQESQ